MEELRKACIMLSQQCDFAASKDGVGFNGADADFGHKLANTPLDEWSKSWGYYAHKMIQKYKKQLLGLGMDISSIPCPSLPTYDPQQKKAELGIDGYIYCTFPYNNAAINTMRFIGGRWQRDDRKWKIKPTEQNKNIIVSLIMELELQHEQTLIDYLLSITDIVKEINVPINKEQVTIKGLKKELKPFQQEGVQFVVNNERCFIADEMGLGKTVQAIASIEALDDAYPCLVVCPASVKINWQKEIDSWVDREISILPSPHRSKHFTIINYDILQQNKKLLQSMKFQSIIMDESHYLKNKKAIRTRMVAELVKPIPYRIMLTGTACLNRPSELVSQLNIIGKIKDFGGAWNFLQRYCGAYHNGWGWDFTGATHREELHNKLISSCFIRRNKADVLGELPAKAREIVYLHIDNRSEYQYAYHDFESWMDDNGCEVGEAEHLVKIEKLKQLAVDGKMNGCVEWIRNFIDSGEKLVVFAHHIHVVKRLLKEFNGAASITGNQKAEERHEHVDRFQTDDTCRLIVCSLQAAGIGITLTAASNVAFIELGWTPGIMLQAEDRCHRIGQTNSVTAWYLLAENTIEEKIYNMILNKKINTDIVHDGKIKDLMKALRSD